MLSHRGITNYKMPTTNCFFLLGTNRADSLRIAKRAGFWRLDLGVWSFSPVASAIDIAGGALLFRPFT